MGKVKNLPGYQAFNQYISSNTKRVTAFLWRKPHHLMPDGVKKVNAYSLVANGTMELLESERLFPQRSAFMHLFFFWKALIKQFKKKPHHLKRGRWIESCHRSRNWWRFGIFFTFSPQRNFVLSHDDFFSYILDYGRRK